MCLAPTVRLFTASLGQRPRIYGIPKHQRLGVGQIEFPGAMPRLPNDRRLWRQKDTSALRCPNGAARCPYLVKISFVPAIRRTVARQSEITLTAKCLLPKCDPTMPPMIAAAARISPSEGTERT